MKKDMFNKLIFWVLLLINNAAALLLYLILLMSFVVASSNFKFFLTYFLFAFFLSLCFSLLSLFFSWAFKNTFRFSSRNLKRIFFVQFGFFFIVYLGMFLKFIWTGL